MKAEFKEPWIKALRSGEYEQAQGVLRQIFPESSNAAAYCCLGVLTEIDPETKFTSEGLLYPPVTEYEDLYCPKFGDDRDLVLCEDEELSRGLLEKYGLNATEMSHLVKMNDDEGESFNYIADWIEKNL